MSGRLWFFLLALIGPSLVYGQKYMSVASEVSFFSSAPLEDIEATNSEAKSAFDLSTDQIVFSVPIKSFVFSKSLMQEHFNEKYMESEKYPTARFQGKLLDVNEVGGTSWAEGELEIHGLVRTVKVPGKLMFSEDQARLTCVFSVRLADYKIKIPKLMFQNIAEEIEITLAFDYELFEN